MPRSGSTWLSKRISKLYSLKLISEPFRVIFGSKIESPLNPTKRLCSSSIGDPSFWGTLSSIESDNLEHIKDFFNKTDNFLIKETNLTLQIDFYNKLLNNIDTVILLRHPVAIFYSHLKIENMFETWNYDLRIDEFRKFLKTDNNYSHLEKYYSNAEKEEFRGSRKFSLLFAHIVAQYKYLESRPEPKLFYEDLVKDLRKIQKVFPFNEWSVANENTFNLDNEDKKAYKTHGTKNPINPYAWYTNMFEEDMQVLERIAEEELTNFNTPKDIKILSTNNNNLPEISFPGEQKISNRVITIGEFCNFLNTLIEHGIDAPHTLLSVNASIHTISYSGKRYIPRKPNKPMVFVSPVAALAYANFEGFILPKKSDYIQLNKIINQNNYMDNYDQINFGENIGETNIPGKFKSFSEYYDLCGNIKEMCVDDDMQIFLSGGSYKDELEDLGLDKLTQFPLIFRDMDTGFRVKQSDKKIIKEDILRIIKNNNNPIKIYKELSKYSY